MKATIYEMHMSMLGLKNLKQVRDEKLKSTYGTKHEQHEKMKGTRHFMYKSTYDK